MSLDRFKQLDPVRGRNTNLPATHRFRGAPMYEDGDGREFYESFVGEIIEMAASDRWMEVKVGYEHRLDLLAYEIYGSSKYWWVLALANDIIDPYEEVVAGMMLRYPSPVRLFADNLVNVL